ncbi:GNAT family N-acetyltransferase [Kitasatospora sp. NPDC056138]|uniref:GNAT family N-acetyltransferase n=1 Tax=Kitasatospora sp. NPDC056138 TaxID=3345724 RepID=UPI0035DB46DB
MAPELAVVRSTAELDREQWDALVPPSRVYLRYDWLRAVEQCFGFDLVFFLLRRDGRTVAGLQALVVRGPDEFPYHDPAGALFGDYELDHLRRALAHGRPVQERARAGALLDAVARSEAAFTRASGYPALVVTSPYGYVGDVLTLPSVDRRSAIDRLLEAVGDHCREQGIASCCLLWQSGADPVLHRALADHGYLEFLSDLEYELDVGPLSGFDDYLGLLDSKRRVAVRSEVRRFADSGMRLERAGAPDRAVIARCAQLSAGQQEKYGLPVDRAAMERLFTALLTGRSLGAVLHLVRRPAAPEGQDIAGFLLCLQADGVLHPKFLGFDAGAVGANYAYFNLVFYHLVEQAIAAGAHRIGYGMGSADAKRRRGCGPVEVRGWIRFCDPAVQRRLEPYITVFHCLKRQLLASPDGDRVRP